MGHNLTTHPENERTVSNNRIPAIVDQDPVDGRSPISVFESGAILQYLAEKTGRFLPTDLRGRVETMEWLFWQMGGLGPMLGQNHHFAQYAPEKIPYAINRYVKEAERLYGVLNKQLSEKEFIAGEYSIADMAAYPWIVSHELQQINFTDFPNVQRWFESLQNRPAIKRAYAKTKEINP